MEQLIEGGTTRLLMSLLGSKTTIGVTTCDAVGPKVGEATQVTTAMAAFDRLSTLALWPDGSKLTEDRPEGDKDRMSWPPLPVAQGRFELSLLKGDEIERFCTTPSSFMACTARPPLLDLAPSLDLLDYVRTCLRTSNSTSESLTKFPPPLAPSSSSSRAPRLRRSTLLSDLSTQGHLCMPAATCS